LRPEADSTCMKYNRVHATLERSYVAWAEPRGNRYGVSQPSNNRKVGDELKITQARLVCVTVLTPGFSIIGINELSRIER